MNFILLTATMFGIATFMPGLTDNRRDWFGLRCLLAMLAIPAVLYLGNVVLGLPLDWLARGFALVGAGGILLTVVRIGRNKALRREAFGRLAHPVWTLTLVVFLVASMHRFPGYMPFPGDEVASWLRLTKQIFLANAYWSDRLDYHLGAYTNGWPLMTAFPSLVWGRFADADLGPLPYLMHLALIGTAFDVIRDWCRRDGIETGLAGLCAALLVFLLTAVEALWVLYPSDMLIDRPMLYVWAAILLLGLAGIARPELATRNDRLRGGGRLPVQGRRDRDRAVARHILAGLAVAFLAARSGRPCNAGSPRAVAGLAPAGATGGGLGKLGGVQDR